MATAAPVKTQPLHNFPVSLKWVQRQAQAQPQAQQIQPSRPDSQDTDTSSDPEPLLPHHRVGPRSTRLQRLSFNSCSTSSSLTQRLYPSLTSKNQADIQQENAARPWNLRPKRRWRSEGAATPISAQVHQGERSSGVIGRKWRRGKHGEQQGKEEVLDCFVQGGDRGGCFHYDGVQARQAAQEAAQEHPEAPR